MKTVPPDAVNGRSATFLITPAGTDAWAITVTRAGMVEETIAAATRAEACRLSRRLTDSGIVGFIQEHPAMVDIRSMIRTQVGGSWRLVDLDLFLDVHQHLADLFREQGLSGHALDVAIVEMMPVRLAQILDNQSVN